MAEQQNLKMPTHVAIILDGNGRWAKSKGMPRNYGHVQGAKTVETICEEAGFFLELSVSLVLLALLLVVLFCALDIF